VFDQPSLINCPLTKRSYTISSPHRLSQYYNDSTGDMQWPKAKRPYCWTSSLILT